MEAKVSKDGKDKTTKDESIVMNKISPSRAKFRSEAACVIKIGRTSAGSSHSKTRTRMTIRPTSLLIRVRTHPLVRRMRHDTLSPRGTYRSKP